MLAAHYPLQALLYSVALHRYPALAAARLRPGAAPRRRALPVPARHVRPGRPRSVDGVPCGVFGWRPPAALVAELSGLLRRRRAVTARADWTCRLGAAGHRPAADVQRGRRARARRRARRPAPRAARAGARRAGAARGRAGRARAAVSARCASTSADGAADTVAAERRGARSTSPALPWPDPAELAGGVRAQPARGRRRRRRRRAGRCGSPTGCSTSTATGARRSRSAASCSSAPSAAPPPVDPARLRAALDRLFPGDGHERQRLAAAVSALRWVSVLAGGPGTGKTTTVARLLAVLHDQPGGPPRIALAAPTGKAAARLEEAVREVAGELPDADRDALGDLHASTLHRLLGRRPELAHPVPARPQQPAAVRRRGRRRDLDGLAHADGPAAGGGTPGRPARPRRRPRPARLGRGRRGARRPRARGRDAPSPRSTPRLRELSAAAARRRARRQRRGHARPDLALRRRHRRARRRGPRRRRRRRGRPAAGRRPSDVEFVETDIAGRAAAPPGWTACAPTSCPRPGRSPRRPAPATSTPRCAGWTRTGCCARTGAARTASPAGPREVERWLAGEIRRDADDGEWYPGRPLLVTANDYDVGLYNGDTGVVVRIGDGVRAAFARGGDARADRRRSGSPTCRPCTR